MWRIFYLLGTSFSVVLADPYLFESCDLKKCDLPSTFDYLLRPEKLLELCPSIKSFLDCSKDQSLVCLGASLLGLGSSNNVSVEALESIHVGAEGLINDLCDQESQLHKKYSKNYDCVRNVIRETSAMELCAVESTTQYGAYKNQLGTETTKNEDTCLDTTHFVACLAMELMQQCGEEARDLFLNIMKRTKILYYPCTLSDVSQKKKQYIEYLELEPTRKYVFEKAFDF